MPSMPSRRFTQMARTEKRLMRLLDLQRRLREIGRIRIGEQVPTSNGRTRPSKLATFRLTSRDRKVIDAAAERFGGTVEPWESPDGQQWQVKTDVDELTVVVPPGDMSFSQSYEVWSAGGCKIRCDGQWNVIADQPCSCDPTARTCDIHTRLSVLLTDLPGFGVWRLDTQGYYATVELGGVVDIAASFSDAGKMLPARLRLEQRSVKRVVDGKTETRRFAVPTLDLDVPVLALVRASGSAGELEAGPTFEPVPVNELPDATQSVAGQLAAVDELAQQPRRRNSAAPIPPTGLQPRTAEDAERDVLAEQPAFASEAQHDALIAAVEELTADEKKTLAAWWSVGWGSLRRRNLTEDQAVQVAKKVTELVHARDAGTEPSDGGMSSGITVKQIATAASKAFPLDDAPRGQKTKQRDRLRYALTFIVTNGERWHLNDLRVDEMTKLDARLSDVEHGRITYEYDETGATFRLNDNEVRVEWTQIEPEQQEIGAAS